MTTLYELVTVKLGYRKLCARWVPKMLTEEHKKKRMGSALDFLARYAEAGEKILHNIVTDDETWVYHHTPESKQQSNGAIRIHKKPRNAKLRFQQKLKLLLFGTDKAFFCLNLCLPE
ncbi:uncharacterized protein TNCT_255141 [Trichonephila clavata]|uniref:Transposase n=1 Tax=Trichonephila clavata TaxID=2740835 RepID=A0A8X6LEE1_TRICU|nr:uncharacterized protein TNCT_255141 [Trichonephila clavata]